MKNLKNLGISLFVGTLVFGIFYLFGSFANVTFYISEWGSNSLECVAIMGGLISLLAAATTFMALKEADL